MHMSGLVPKQTDGRITYFLWIFRDMNCLDIISLALLNKMDKTSTKNKGSAYLAFQFTVKGADNSPGTVSTVNRSRALRLTPFGKTSQRNPLMSSFTSTDQQHVQNKSCCRAALEKQTIKNRISDIVSERWPNRCCLLLFHTHLVCNAQQSERIHVCTCMHTYIHVWRDAVVAYALYHVIYVVRLYISCFCHAFCMLSHITHFKSLIEDARCQHGPKIMRRLCKFMQLYECYINCSTRTYSCYE